ncbi:hypothetical protein N7534_012089 [Penicillium rubens]|nr:hypothetical protein N7534_012089 [Penicillium rubens]
MPSRNTPGFAFIAAPIQQLFKNHSSSLSAIFKVLSVLLHNARQFQFAPFETTLPLLEGLPFFVSDRFVKP